MSDAKHTPVEIRAPRGSDIVEIDWADGLTARYTTQVLRAFCPSAEWQGHGGPLRYIEGGQTELLEIEEIGNYALRLVWPDCGTGIYTFRLLRALGEPQDGDLREQVFPH